MQTQVVNSLKEHGLKVTPQRVTILTAIERQGHANIDEIYQEAKTTNPTMSLATVYKNVTSLIETNLLKEVAINNQKSKYELTKEPHSHLICKQCGSVEDINSNNLFTLNRDNLDFDIEDIELNIYGVCSKCKKDK